jgi:hypothetical protein
VARRKAKRRCALQRVGSSARLLYALEAIVPPGAPPPVMFQTSLHMLDENGECASFDIDPDGQRTDLGRPTVY